VFDGHGGRQVSDYCAERFPVEIRKEFAKNPTSLNGPLETVFTNIDNQLRLIDSDGCGSTACAAVVRQEGGSSVLYVANIGDTRAVLNRSGKAERLSIDDKGSDN
jgi:serine/threonine protein phosphatase PrpC